MLKSNKTFLSSALVLILAASFATSCGSGGSSASGGVTSGSTSVFLLNTIEWGRLVNIVDLNGVAVKSNMVVEQEIQTDATYELTTNALTDQATLRIKFAVGTQTFDTAFAALDDALPELEIKGPLGFGGQPSTPPFPALPRNAALKLTFNNEIDGNTINFNTVRLLHGSPAVVPFSLRYLHDAENPRILVLDPTISQYEADTEGLQANSIGFPESLTTLIYNLKLAIPDKNASSIFGILRDIFGHGLTATSSDPVEASSVVRVFRSAMDGDAVAEFLVDNSSPSLVAQRKISISSIATNGAKMRITYSFQLTSVSGAVDTLDEGICWLKPGVGDVFAQGSAFGVVLSAGDAAPSGVSPCNPASPTNTSCFVVDVTVLGGVFSTGAATTRHLYVDANDAERKPCFVDYSLDPGGMDLPSGAGSHKTVGVHPATAFTFHFSKPMNPSTILANDDIVLGNVDRDPTVPANTGTGTSFGLVNGPSASYPYSLVPFQVVPSFDQKSFRVQLPTGLRNDEAAGSFDGACTGLAPTGYQDNCHYLYLLLGGVGPRDLADNPVPTIAGSGTAPFLFKISRIFPQAAGGSASTHKANGVSLRFNTANLVEDGATSNSVIGGQYSFGSTPGQISGRPVQHFSRVCDQGVVPNPSAIVELMAAAGSLGTSPGGGPATPIRPPLVPQGARMQQIYRYFDLGFTIGDTDSNRRVDDFGFFNLDVEGLNWTPDGGSVLPDRFSLISITLGHSQFAPDEYVNNSPTCVPPAQALLCSHYSGLGGSATTPFFADNFYENFNAAALESSTDFGPKNTFVGTYLIDPLKQFQFPSSGQATTVLMPWPSFVQTFVWRDTRLVNRNDGRMVYAGTNANGIDPDVYCNAGLYTDAAGNTETNCFVCAGMPAAPICQQSASPGWANAPAGGFAQGSKISDFNPTNYPPSNPNDATVPTIGLPLLVDFKVYPDPLAAGNNRLRGLEANSGGVINTPAGPLFLYPRFRMLSAGGVPLNSTPVNVFPDVEFEPRGEVISTQVSPTDKGDDVVYVGQVDFVTKTSVIFTRWFATGATSPQYTSAILEPTASELGPLGLIAEVAFRGGTGTLLSNSAEANGLNMDPYGNFPGSSVITPTTGWSTDISSIDGSANFQVRITFKGNATANLAPWLTGLQVAWEE